MSENIDKGLITRQLMTYGAIIGVITIVYSLILYASGTNEFLSNENESFFATLRPIIVGLGIFYSVRHLGEKVLKQKISFGRFIFFGTAVGVFYAIINSAYMVVFLKYVSPSTLTSMLEATKEVYATWNLPIDSNLISEMIQKPIMIFMSQLFGDIMISAFYSLIFAILYTVMNNILHKKN